MGTSPSRAEHSCCGNRGATPRHSSGAGGSGMVLGKARCPWSSGAVLGCELALCAPREKVLRVTLPSPCRGRGAGPSPRLWTAALGICFSYFLQYEFVYFQRRTNVKLIQWLWVGRFFVEQRFGSLNCCLFLRIEVLLKMAGSTEAAGGT